MRDPTPISPDAVWVVVAAYNESEAIAQVILNLTSHYPNVIVVDDGSEDATGERARQAGATVLQHVVNLGQGAALQTGIEYALAQGARFIVTFDADGQHNVGDIRSLLRALQETGASVALGSRFLGKAVAMPWTRKIIIKLAIRMSHLSTGLALTDAHNGLRAFDRHAANLIELRQNRMAHASEIIAQISSFDLNHVEVPVTVSYTPYSLRKGQKVSNALNIVSELFLQWLSK